jgi:hypothetical protein
LFKLATDIVLRCYEWELRRIRDLKKRCR